MDRGEAVWELSAGLLERGDQHGPIAGLSLFDFFQCLKIEPRFNIGSQSLGEYFDRQGIDLDGHIAMRCNEGVSPAVGRLREIRREGGSLNVLGQ